MFVSRVELANYKVFRESISIDLAPDSSPAGVSVLLGRNGAGKSTLFEAVHWVLFGKQCPAVRQSSLSREVVVKVILRSRQVSRVSLEITRRCYKGKTTLQGTRWSEEDSSGMMIDEPLTAGQVQDLLLTDLGINTKTDADKIILRQNATSLALGDPQALLGFVEEAAGTAGLVASIKECGEKIDAALALCSQREAALEVVSHDIDRLTPDVKLLFQVREGRLQLEQQWCGYFSSLGDMLRGELSRLEDPEDHTEALVTVAEDARLAKEALKQVEGDERKLHKQYQKAAALKTSRDKALREAKSQQAKLIKTRNDAQSKLVLLQRADDQGRDKARGIAARLAELREELGASETRRQRLEADIKEHPLVEVDGIEALLQRYARLEERRNIVELEQSIAGREKLHAEMEKRARDEAIAARRLETELQYHSTRIVALETQCTSGEQQVEALRTQDTMIAEHRRALEAEQRELEYLASNHVESQHANRALRSAVKFIRRHRGTLGIIDLLCNAVQPKREDATVALLSVLGDVSSSLLVKSRQDALACSDLLRGDDSTSIRSIDILDESSVSPHLSTLLACPLPPHCSSLLDHLTISRPEARPIITKRLAQWILFEGSNDDALKLKLNANVVTRNGYKFLRDGEIRTYESRGEQWPALTVSAAAVFDVTDVSERLKQVPIELQCADEQLYIVRPLLEAASRDLAAMKQELQGKRASAVDLLRRLETRPVAPVPVDASTLQADRERLRSLQEQNTQELLALKEQIVAQTGVADEALVQTQFHALAVARSSIGEELLVCRKLCAEEKGLVRASKLESQRTVERAHKAKETEAALQHAEEEMEAAEDLIKSAEDLASAVSEEFDAMAAQQREVLMQRTKAAKGSQKAEKILQELRSRQQAALRDRQQLERRVHEADEGLQRAVTATESLEREMATLEALLNDPPKSTAPPAAAAPQRRDLEGFHRELSMQTKVIAAKEAKLDASTTGIFLRLHRDKDEAVASVDEAKLMASEQKRLQLELETQRFTLVTDALAVLNANIGGLYGRIVKSGDCFLSFPSDRVSLFLEGITFRAQHGRSAWLDVSKLSGGQQATCGLSLVLAMQELNPFPFYLMDEIDASLDTRTVTRMGMLLRERAHEKNSQYIVVSHRPELHEFASSVTGLYIHSGVPKAFTHSVDA